MQSLSKEGTLKKVLTSRGITIMSSMLHVMITKTKQFRYTIIINSVVLIKLILCTCSSKKEVQSVS